MAVKKKKIPAFLDPSIVVKQRYVRIPCQMSTKLVDLKTDVKSTRIYGQYVQAIEQLSTLSMVQPIIHLRTTISTIRCWQPTYERILSAYHELNRNRWMRRMRITGFRLFNVEAQLHNLRRLHQDVYVSGYRSAAILYSNILSVLSAGFDTITLIVEYRGGARLAKQLQHAAAASPLWGRQWHQMLVTTLPKSFRISYTVPRLHARDLLILLLCDNGEHIQHITGQLLGFRIDFDTEWDTLVPLHSTEDINIILEGVRIRRFQTFGRLHSSTK